MKEITAEVRQLEDAEQRLVVRGKAALKKGDTSSWEAADVFAELSDLWRWSTRKIAKEFDTNHTSVARFIRCVEAYASKDERPRFWDAYREIIDPTDAQNIVASTENEWYTPAKYIEAAHRVMDAINRIADGTSES